jgi:Uncharacterised protein family (UPF0153).
MVFQGSIGGNKKGAANVDLISCLTCHRCCSNLSQLLKKSSSSSLFSDKLKDEFINFPYKTKIDGSCEKLQNGKCSIYEERPIACDSK